MLQGKKKKSIKFAFLVMGAQLFLKHSKSIVNPVGFGLHISCRAGEKGVGDDELSVPCYVPDLKTHRGQWKHSWYFSFSSCVSKVVDFFFKRYFIYVKLTIQTGTQGRHLTDFLLPMVFPY